MSPEDIKKLLGGYATGTLTAEEQQALFAAALEDQKLFDALAREQSLRDLLRDPAARAELLSALDTPASRAGGFWQWLGRPAVVGLAMAGVAAIAVVAVWQGTRVARLKPAAPEMVAELKQWRAEPAPGSPEAQPTPPANQPAASTRDKGAAAAGAEKKTAPAMARAPSRHFDAGTPSGVAGSAGELMKEKQAVTAMEPTPARQAEASIRSGIAAGLAAPVADKKSANALAPPPPPPAMAPAPMPVLIARKAGAEADATPAAVRGGLVAGAVQENLRLDARALFYLDQPVAGANAFVGASGGGGATLPPANQAAIRKDDAPQRAKGASGLAATMTAAAPRLGVRVSILRGEGEMDLTTMLDAGETVRLKLIPNADGFLYVAEGAHIVASGAAKRLQPFETPELRFEGSGQKQLYVMLSRTPWTVDLVSLGSLSRDNLVASPAGQERGTYIVSGPLGGGAQQVVVPVTLTYK